MSECRKRAAILVADVVGYSRLAGADEERTLARLRPLRRMTAMARTPVLPKATPVGALSAQLGSPRPRSAMSAVRRHQSVGKRQRASFDRSLMSHMGLDMAAGHDRVPPGRSPHLKVAAT
jgi:hypothetical protein